MERILTELVEKLQRAHGDRLVSVVLYGSGAEPEDKDSYSDYNVLCVLRDIGPHDLGACETIFRWWRGLKNPAPLLLSEAEVRTSTDCFPIEFHDLKECHRILFGSDLVTGLEVDDSFYRAQVEHELRAKLLRLRQKAGGVLSERDLLLRLMANSLSTFCVLFRHALRLTGAAPRHGKREIIAAAEKAFGLESAPLLALLDFREEKVKPKDLQPVPLFGQYLKQIQVVLDAVDRIEK